MIILTTARGFLRPTATGYSPLDDSPTAWFTSREEGQYTFYAARTAASYEAASGVITLTCNENPTGFSTVGAGDEIIVDTGNSEVDGEFTLTGAAGATVTYSQPSAGDTGSPVSLSGTVEWKYRKVSALLDKTGTYSLTAPSLALAPHFDSVNARLLGNQARGHYLDIPAGLRTALTGTNFTTWFVGQRNASSGGTGIIGPASGTSYRLYVSDTAAGFRVGTPVLSWTSGDVNNGNLKAWWFEGQAANRYIYSNDAVTEKSTSASATTPTLGVALYYMRDLATYWSGYTLDIGFFANSQDIRERLKAWGELQGDSYG